MDDVVGSFFRLDVLHRQMQDALVLGPPWKDYLGEEVAVALGMALHVKSEIYNWAIKRQSLLLLIFEPYKTRPSLTISYPDGLCR